MNNYKHEIIMCIVNSGFSETVMDAARELGARGGTVIRARGTANAEAEKLYGIAIQPEKEIVMILVDKALKNDILHAVYKSAGLNTPGQGIAFAMPVEDVVGIEKTFEEFKGENSNSAYLWKVYDITAK